MPTGGRSCSAGTRSWPCRRSSRSSRFHCASWWATSRGRNRCFRAWASSRTLPRSAMLAKAPGRPPGKENALGKENERLRARLEELEETLRAIRSGEVDGLVVETTGGEQIFTLKSADQTYRWMVEEMQKGAATLSDEGVVLYCNPFLAALLDVPVEAVMGAPLAGFLDEQAAVSLSGLLQAAESGVSRGEVSFRRGGGSVPTHVSFTPLALQGAAVLWPIVTDLRGRNRRGAEPAGLR